MCLFDKVLGKNLGTSLLSQNKQVSWTKSLEKKTILNSVTVWGPTSPVHDEGKA